MNPKSAKLGNLYMYTLKLEYYEKLRYHVFSFSCEMLRSEPNTFAALTSVCFVEQFLLTRHSSGNFVRTISFPALFFRELGVLS